MSHAGRPAMAAASSCDATEPAATWRLRRQRCFAVAVLSALAGALAVCHLLPVPSINFPVRSEGGWLEGSDGDALPASLPTLAGWPFARFATTEMRLADARRRLDHGSGDAGSGDLGSGSGEAGSGSGDAGSGDLGSGSGDFGGDAGSGSGEPHTPPYSSSLSEPPVSPSASRSAMYSSYRACSSAPLDVLVFSAGRLPFYL